jgi:hypothetical protein
LSISKKSSKIKFLEKFQKIFLNFYVKNGAERHLGDLRGTHHATSLPKNHDTPAQTRVPAALHLDFFDLLAQPIIVAEIWSIRSPVCDSFDCPSRIFFSGVFLEYFSSIGCM